VGNCGAAGWRQEKTGLVARSRVNLVRRFLRFLSDVRSMHVLMHIQVSSAYSRSYLERAQSLALRPVGQGPSLS
jgi:hypothetical protein